MIYGAMSAYGPKRTSAGASAYFRISYLVLVVWPLCRHILNLTEQEWCGDPNVKQHLGLGHSVRSPDPLQRDLSG